MNSSAIPAPTSTSTPTVPCEGIPNLDLSGLNGSVCAVSIPPSELNLTSCCGGTLRVINDCTQYCQVDDEDDFRSCLSSINNGSFEGSLCQPAGGNGSRGGGNGTTADTNSARTLGPIFGTSAIGILLSLGFVASLL